MEKTDFPAKLVLSAIREDRLRGGHKIVAFADNRVLQNEDDLNRRHAYHQNLESSGALPYNYTVVPVNDLDEALADIKAELEAQLQDEAGDAATPPAPEDPPAKEESSSNDTIDLGNGQSGLETRPEIVLTVQYMGTGAAITPTGEYPGATCKLVGYRDGRTSRPPDKNVARLRLWLKQIGYEPHYPGWAWLKRGAPPRERREAYRYVGAANDLYDETLDCNALRQLARENPPSRLSEVERLALYKRKAFAGEGPFAACPGCPQIDNCPHGWGACDRKAAFLKAKKAGQPRYELFVPGVVG